MNRAGATMTMVSNGSNPERLASTTARYAAPTRISPCARFTTRMTPNTSVRPSAETAYSPPRSSPSRM